MEIVKINPFEQPEVVMEIAKVYQETFGGAPWNEGYLCPVCGEYFALSCESKKTCPACSSNNSSVNLIHYWPTEKVVSDFYQEMKKEASVCLVAYLDSEIVGFAWGYKIIMCENTDKYLGFLGLNQKLGEGEFFYLDEVGIKPNNQCKGFGRKIIEHIFHQQNEKNILLRTMIDSQMYFLIKKMGGENVLSLPGSKKIIMTLSFE